MAVSLISSFIPVVCLLAVAPSLRAEMTWKRRIAVSQHDGVDARSCWNETYSSIPCKTLDYALAHVTNSTLVQLVAGKWPYNLSQHFNFTNLHGFELVGDPNSMVSIECRENGGSLSFQNCDNTTLTGILLRGCGGLHASTTGRDFKHPHVKFFSAVFLVYCRNIVIDHCSIVDSPGIGLNMYDIGGEVRISHSQFVNNRPGNVTDKDVAIAGGGIYMELTYRGGTFPFDFNATALAQFDANSSYTFYNCTFKKNYAPRQQHETIVNLLTGDDHIPFGRGGGLSIFVKGKAENNVIRVTGCHFENNNAIWGGGIFIEFHDKVQNNTFEVIDSVFRNNIATYAGGGIRSGTTAGDHQQGLHPNKMKYELCKFENNTAILGGGVSFYEWHSFFKGSGDELHIEYKNCLWRNNTATMGAAIGLATQAAVNGLPNSVIKGPKLYVVILEDCNITNNHIILTEDKQVIGQGAIYSYSLPVILKGVVYIEHNDNTAMVVENVVLHIFGHVTFQNNTGGEGGALGLYGLSLLMLMPNSTLHFFNNTAQKKGGAIYVKDAGPPVVAFNTTELKTRQCFLAYNHSYSLRNVTEWQTQIVFRGNQVIATGGGDSVYASTLQGCREDGVPRINHRTLEWKDTIQYQDANKSREAQISTDPVLIKFNEREWIVSPSEVFNPTVELIDEKNSSVLGVVMVTITEEHNQNSASDVRLGTASKLFLVLGDHPKINNLHLVGGVKRPFKVQLSTVMGRVVQNSSKGKLTLQHCNDGFEQTDSKTCSCISSSVESGISNCSSDAKYVFLKRGYWGGIKDNKFSTYPCPPNYCNFPNDGEPTFQYNPETMCTKGRNGTSILCGACKNGYSVNLGNDQCRPSCSNIYILLALVFCLVTPLLVLMVFRINLDIFTTYLNTWLYSYQITLFLLQEGQNLDPFITFVIGLANWHINGAGTCFYKGMTNLQKLGVNYIFPLYVLLLLVILAKIANCRPACYINRNVSRAFCTLLVVCYTNVTMISFNIVHYVPIQGRRVLYADGNIDFTRDWKEHLPFTIIACLWIVLFVIFIPLILLFTPWFLKHIHYLKHFRLYYDNFQKCFKNEFRWFAAFYFLCRIYILLIALYVPFGPLKRSILEVSCVLIAVTGLYFRPYNGQYECFNRLDAVLLTNLCLIVSFSSGIVSEAPTSVFNGLSVIVNLLAYVPLVYLLVLVLYHGWKYCCPKEYDGYIAGKRPASMTETGLPPSPLLQELP